MPGSRSTMLIAALAMFSLAACGGGSEDDSAAEAPSVFFSDEVAPLTRPESEAQVVPVDYADPAAWLCLPGRADACEADTSVTLVAPDGGLLELVRIIEPDPPIDCFYVYPTVSTDAAANSDIVPGEAEHSAAANQAAPFSEDCRVYAPMYRQVTLSALRAMLADGASVTDREMAYADVRAAWRHYVATYNDGRGVVLIGHSQGAGVLARLLDSEIGPSVQREQIVSVVLAGFNLHRRGQSPRAGELPVCENLASYGCVIAYGSYRADAPPGPDAIFGALPGGGEAVCVNPAELDGSAGALDARLPVGQAFETTLPPPAWTDADEAIETPFVALPGMLSARCVSDGGRSYLAVTVAGDPEDDRVDEIVGDIVLDGVVQPAWGLHVLDINLALGNLLSIVDAQGAAWLAAQGAAAPAPVSEPTP